MICQSRPKRRLDCIHTIPGDSLNGRFIKEGKDFPFCGFSKPSYDHTDKKMKPGMEIFFQDSYPWAESFQHRVQPLIKDIEEIEESDSKDSFNLQTLGLALYMVHSGTTLMDHPIWLKLLIHPSSTGMLRQFYLLKSPLTPMFTLFLLLLSILAQM